MCCTHQLGIGHVGAVEGTGATHVGTSDERLNSTASVGAELGCSVRVGKTSTGATTVGTGLGALPLVGADDGALVLVGAVVGTELGRTEGSLVGRTEGILVGCVVGFSVGTCVHQLTCSGVGAAVHTGHVGAAEGMGVVQVGTSEEKLNSTAAVGAELGCLERVGKTSTGATGVGTRLGALPLVGAGEGALVLVGAVVGTELGRTEGTLLGCAVGHPVGCSVGGAVHQLTCSGVGAAVHTGHVGAAEGTGAVGAELGCLERVGKTRTGATGVGARLGALPLVGAGEGKLVGCAVGISDNPDNTEEKLNSMLVGCSEIVGKTGTGATGVGVGLEPVLGVVVGTLVGWPVG